MLNMKRYAINVFGQLWGVEYSRVEVEGVPYLDRYIVYVAGCTLRLHKFWRGDDDRAPHDHPWNFITFPFRDYLEHVQEPSGREYVRVVKRLRFHYRPSGYRHIVLHGLEDISYLRDGLRHKAQLRTSKPFWTIVITGRRTRSWGFWPEHDHYIYWRDWT